MWLAGGTTDGVQFRGPGVGTGGGSGVVTYLDSKLLRGNPGGENPLRRMSVCLPPGYDERAARRYPVLYYLHGFA
ncbi:hypothetical protein [Hymenobacter coccineus]|uniref:Esterase n=1 Tax=Hymenobacter coccineus TaxID=1908235 RepID=A0A1G1TM47_9BACT|nr:hypothetical protein [Hymenobacter coccineus]OGX91923.1 hypothetical protein BEN49_03795 [Hymenobacter coccineus]